MEKPNNMNTEIERINKQTELIKSVLVEFLQTIREIRRQEVINEELYRLENKLTEQLTQPEGYQGLNKWYVTHFDSVLFIDNEDINLGGYGVVKGVWVKSKGLTLKHDINRLATESEIIEAIKKGLEQHGIVEGARAWCLDNDCLYNINFVMAQYEKEENQLWLCSDLHDIDVCVFDNGTFAEVVKEEKEPTFQSGLSYTVVDIDTPIVSTNVDAIKAIEATVDISSDKELLKECLTAFRCLSLINNKIKIFEELQTKLNKHLNHE